MCGLPRKDAPGLAVAFEESRFVLAVLVEAVVGHHDAILRREAALEMRPGVDLHRLDQVVDLGRGLSVADIHFEEQPSMV